MKRKRRTRLLRALLFTILEKNKDFTNNMIEVMKEILPKKMHSRKKTEIMLQVWDDFGEFAKQVSDDMFEKSPEKRNFQL